MQDDREAQQHAAWLAQLDLDRTRDRIVAYEAALREQKEEKKEHKLEKHPASLDTYISKIAEGGASLSQVLLALTGVGGALSLAIGEGKTVLGAIRKRRETQISESARSSEEKHFKKRTKFEKQAEQKVSGGAHGGGGTSIAFLDAMKSSDEPIEVLGLPLIPGSVGPYLKMLQIAAGVIVAAFAISLFAVIIKKVS